MRKTSKTPSIGTVISGTMNPRDLIPAFLLELDYLGANFPNLGDSPLGGLMDKDFKWYDDDSSDDSSIEKYISSEDCQWDLESLFDALNDLSPDYCYFGGSEGNGSDYGFWPDFQAMEEDLPTASGVDDGHWYDVNDHGNITLYYRSDDGSDQVVWDCV